MSTRTAKLSTALAALAIAGCGGSGDPEGAKLPPSVRQALLPQLQSIDDRVAADVSGACDDIFDPEAGNIGPIDAALASIPEDVDPEIRSALEGSVDRLKQLVDDECAQIAARERQEQEELPEDTDPVEPLPEETDTEEATTETTPEPPPETAPDDEPPSDAPPGDDGTGPPGQGGGIEAPPGGDE
jgi:signal transduction histidine kinase